MRENNVKTMKTIWRLVKMMFEEIEPIDQTNEEDLWWWSVK
jgi:hypothetical protein